MTYFFRTFLACALAAITGGCNTTVVTTSQGADFNKSVTAVAANLKASLSEIQSVGSQTGSTPMPGAPNGRWSTSTSLRTFRIRRLG